MKERLKTTRVNVTLPCLLKTDIQEKAAIAGLSVSRYLCLLLKKKSKTVIIVPDDLLYEIRQINENLKEFQQQGGASTELNYNLQRFIDVYNEILKELRRC